jgi:hypothetical protein
VTQYGWLCLALLPGFGIFGSVQFLRGKSPKYLMQALTLGVFVDLVALIATPLYEAHFEAKERVVISRSTVNHGAIGSLGEESIGFIPIRDRLDWQRFNQGLIVIGIYVLLSIYLMSPPVKRCFVRQSPLSHLPIAV